MKRKKRSLIGILKGNSITYEKEFLFYVIHLNDVSQEGETAWYFRKSR